MDRQFECEFCHVTFTTSDSRRKRRFCSLKCFGAAKVKPPITGNCAYCGKPCEREHSWAKRVKHFFCDHDCHNKWQEQNYARGKDSPHYNSVEVTCAACGAILHRPPNQANNYANQFCNNTCAGIWRSKNKTGKNHPNWKGGQIDSYGPNWNSQRRKAKQRDNFRCQHCQITEKELGRGLDVHHIRPFRTFEGDYEQANNLSNLVTLCRSCHRLAEHEKIPLETMLVSWPPL